jgi:polyisoprenoid-binding protein YceI
VLLVLISLPLNASFAAVKFVKTKGSSEFLAIGNPSAIRIQGKGEGPEGELQVQEEGANLIIGGVLNVDMKSYSTGISLRDRHMKEKYLEVEKFQTAKLTLKNITLAKSDLQKNPETSAAFDGILELHGVQKAVHGTFTLKNTPSGYAVNAKFPIKLSEYSIVVPSFAGITVADQVEVNASSDVEKF